MSIEKIFMCQLLLIFFIVILAFIMSISFIVFIIVALLNFLDKRKLRNKNEISKSLPKKEEESINQNGE